MNEISEIKAENATEQKSKLPEKSKKNDAAKTKKVIKVNDLESAKHLVVESISDYQSGIKTEKECKNIGYLIQVLTGLEKALLDKSQITKIFEFELHKHSNDISIQFEKFLDAAKLHVGEDMIKAIMTEYSVTMIALDSINENIRKDLFEKMQKYAQIRLEPDYEQDVESIIEFIKYSLDRLSMNTRDKIVQYMMRKNYLKNHTITQRVFANTNQSKSGG